jgi:hypothetical protein
MTGLDSQIQRIELDSFGREKLARRANLIANARSNVGNDTGLFRMYRGIFETDYVTEKK